jgi:6-phosphogluconolactonase/glucosamine-6-phosphate isomerase/deaminase
MSVTITTLPTNEVFEAAGGFVVDLLRQDDESLLLLSGGSAIKAYPPIAKAISQQVVSRDLVVGLVDERFGPVGHADSNERLLAEKVDLVEMCQQYGVEFGSVLQSGAPLEQAASQYNEWLKHRWATARRIAVLGIGMDGHTAGILPMESGMFEKIFGGQDLVVGYRLEDGEFAGRLTITPKAISQLTDIVVVATGPAKESVLRNVFGSEVAKSNIAPPHQKPATILHNHPSVTLFTDISIEQ